MSQIVKKGKIVLLIVIALFCSVIIELFGFNYKYWSSSKCETVNLPFDSDKIVLHDITREGDIYKITGELPYFTVDEQGYSSYIEVKINENVKDYKIEVQFIEDGKVKKSKEQSISNIYKDISMLEIKNNIEDIRFVPIILEQDSNEFSFQSLTLQNSMIVNYYRISILFCSMFLIGFLILYRQKLYNKLHVVFIIIVVFVGVNICLINPINYSFDEREHFIRAYELSYGDTGIIGEDKIPWISNIQEFFDWNGGKAYQNIAEKQIFTNKYNIKEYSIQEHHNSTADTYPFIPYIAGAIGIFIGRFIGVSFIWSFYLGRIVSLLGYGLITAWCIKNIKFGKKLLFMIALLPALFFNATAFSADTYTMVFSFLAVTLWSNMMVQEKEISLKQTLFFTVTIALITVCKITYVPLCLLFFTLSNNKFRSDIKAWVSRILVLCISGMVAILTFLYSNTKDINQWNMQGVDVTGQIKFIIMHPMKYLWIVWEDLSNNIITYLSGTINSLAYNVPLKPIWMILILIAVCIVALIEKEQNASLMGKKERGIISISLICSWGLVATALYITFTPVGSETIQGIQGRYMGPLLFPLFLLLKNTHIETTFNEKKFNYLLIIFTVVPILLVLWSVLYHCCG